MERKQIQKRPMFWRWVIVLALSIGFGMEWLPPEGRFFWLFSWIFTF